MYGWKTWTSAILSILYGVVGWIVGLHDIDTMIALVLAGLAMIGIGAKIDKTKLASNDVKKSVDEMHETIRRVPTGENVNNEDPMRRTKNFISLNGLNNKVDSLVKSNSGVVERLKKIENKVHGKG